MPFRPANDRNKETPEGFLWQTTSCKVLAKLSREASVEKHSFRGNLTLLVGACHWMTGTVAGAALARGVPAGPPTQLSFGAEFGSVKLR